MLSEFVKSADWKNEKHVPVITCSETFTAGQSLTITISVGKEIPHPNTAVHHITWIALHYVPEGVKTSIEIARCEFSAHGAAADGPDKGAAYTDSTMTINAKLAASGTLFATAYCNIHGLWTSEKRITLA